MPPHLCETITEFLRHVAEYYVPKGYFFFGAGLAPEDEDLKLMDSKIIDKIEAAKRTRAGRWSKDSAAYMRWDRFYYIWSKDWRHPVFVGQKGPKGDIRVCPCQICDYEISCVQLRSGKYRARIRIGDFFYGMLNDKIFRFGAGYDAEKLTDLFRQYASSPYTPVRDQLVTLLKIANTKRKEAGLGPVPRSAVGLGIAPVRVLKPKR